VHGVPARLCGVRDSHRVVGGSARHARGALADRDLVVVLHGGDGRRVQLPDPPDRTFPLRRRRGGRAGGRRAGGLPVASPARGVAQGIFFAGAHLVGGLTPALVLWMLTFLSWRQIFLCFGALGFIWAAIWLAWFRDDPSQHRSVNAAELETIVRERLPDSGHAAGAGYWRTLFASRNMIALSIMYIPNCMIFYFCITWLPTYLKQRHGFDAASLGIFSGLPLLVSMPGDLLGGVATDRLSARYGLRLGPAGPGAGAHAVAGVALLGAAASSTPVLAASLIAVATGLTMFTLGAAWGTVIEAGRNHVSVVGATMNSTGNLAAMLNPLIVAYSVQWFGSWNVP